MIRSDAATILARKGYAGTEITTILDKAIESGSALTAPRACPSLWVTFWDDDVSTEGYRIQENDSGADYTLETS